MIKFSRNANLIKIVEEYTSVEVYSFSRYKNNPLRFINWFALRQSEIVHFYSALRFVRSAFFCVYVLQKKRRTNFMENKKKAVYRSPQSEAVRFDNDDVVKTSDGNEWIDDNQGEWDKQ